MTYVSWSAFYEGPSDSAYLDVLLPKLMEEIVATHGVRHSDIPASPALLLGLHGRSVEDVAREGCDASDAFELVFIHADTGGRAMEVGLDDRCSAYCERMHALCDFPAARCVTLTPKHETEAWILADSDAVMGALGYRGTAANVGLPAHAVAAEALADPKTTLAQAIVAIRGRRRRTENVEQLFSAIAQRQSLAALRRSASFTAFEGRLRAALADLGCI